MKILTVCGFGVGSSMVLKMTCNKALNDLGVVAEVENTDIMSAKSMKANLILTSPSLIDELSKSVNCPVVAIDKYVDKNEVVEKIKDIVS